jgi:glycosyltransferase involved in cell wall biosynthesis
MDKKGKKLSVIIPVFNSEDSLRQLSRDIFQHCVPAFSSDIEVIFVDDGSVDGSWPEICQIAESTENVVGLRLERNFSQHNALLAGILHSTGEWILTIDDDLQHPLEEVAAMKELTAKGFNLVYGTNALQPVNGRARMLATVATKVAFRLFLGISNAPQISAFRLISGRFRNYARGVQGPTVSIDALLSLAGFRGASHRVSFRRREHGQSNYSAGKLVKHALKTILSFSVVPLQLATLLGIVVIIFSVLVLFYVVARALIEPSVPGFPFLASIISFVSGVQLVMMGIQGLYIGEIHSRCMGYQPFVVGEVVKND